MNRSRAIGALLAAILLVCALVIYLDQKGTFDRSQTASPTPTTAPAVDSKPGLQTTPAPQPAPSGGSESGGYGDLQ